MNEANENNNASDAVKANVDPPTGMDLNCTDRERILEDGSSSEWSALESHAATCVSCAEEIRKWKSLSVIAAELRDYSNSPTLWPCIQRSLAEQNAVQQAKTRSSWGWSWESLRHSFARSWQSAAAAAIVLLLAVSAGVYHLREKSGTPAAPQSSDLLRNNALADVERTESAYMHAIDKLAAEAKPQLDKPEAPLLANYREKLQVLDSAIDDLRAQAGQNPSNAHLRYQLLAMYQEKQRTLEEVLEVKQ